MGKRGISKGLISEEGNMNLPELESFIRSILVKNGINSKQVEEKNGNQWKENKGRGMKRREESITKTEEEEEEEEEDEEELYQTRTTRGKGGGQLVEDQMKEGASKRRRLNDKCPDSENEIRHTPEGKEKTIPNVVNTLLNPISLF